MIRNKKIKTKQNKIPFSWNKHEWKFLGHVLTGWYSLITGFCTSNAPRLLFGFFRSVIQVSILQFFEKKKSGECNPYYLNDFSVFARIYFRCVLWYDIKELGFQISSNWYRFTGGHFLRKRRGFSIVLVWTIVEKGSKSIHELFQINMQIWT